MTAQEIFDQCLNEAESVYRKSSIYQKKFGLSICGTPIQIGKILLIGINWGGGSASDPNIYSTQKEMPSFGRFKEDYEKGDYKFLKRIQPFIEKNCGIEVSSGEFNYFNLCFFRTPNIEELIREDFSVCAPIFKTMVTNIKPEQIISLGTGNVKHLKDFFKDEFTCVENEEAKTITPHKICRGSLFSYKFYSFPHTNAHHLSNEVYEKMWEMQFKN